MNIHASSGLRTKKETTLVRNERAHEKEKFGSICG